MKIMDYAEALKTIEADWTLDKKPKLFARPLDPTAYGNPIQPRFMAVGFMGSVSPRLAGLQLVRLDDHGAPKADGYFVLFADMLDMAWEVVTIDQLRAEAAGA